MKYDYIIVGGGSSGCVLANRLSANPENSVLLIEAGRADDHKFIHIPCGFSRVLEEGKDSVVYMSTASDATAGRSIIVPQGKVIGGGSSVNAMCYIRGQRKDYDAWEKMGNQGWGWKDVLPIFKFLEKNQRFSNEYHGTDGELMVSDRGYTVPASSAFVKAAQEVGIPYNDDFNGEKQDGIGFYQTTTGNAKRCSAAVAFLHPIRHRKNLHIHVNTKVDKVLFEGKQAVGVLLADGEKIKCNKEVLMCAGAIETPRLLQLSGVGNAEHLSSLDIPVVANLPGVGENFQDHMLIRVLSEFNKPISFFGQDRGLRAVINLFQYLLTKSGVLVSNVLESGGFINIKNDPYGVDAQFHVLPILLGDAEHGMISKHGMSTTICFLRPKSRGSVRIQSADPDESAIFDSGALTHDYDVSILTEGVKKILEILDAPSLKKHITKIYDLDNTDEASLEKFVRNGADTVYHPVGTCKMGIRMDPMSVVDNKLRVHGLTGLRVCDASIMPKITSGNTNAPTMVIAEKASRYILGQS